MRNIYKTIKKIQKKLAKHLKDQNIPIENIRKANKDSMKLLDKHTKGI